MTHPPGRRPAPRGSRSTPAARRVLAAIVALAAGGMGALPAGIATAVPARTGDVTSVHVEAGTAAAAAAAAGAVRATELADAPRPHPTPPVGRDGRRAAAPASPASAHQQSRAGARPASSARAGATAALTPRTAALRTAAARRQLAATRAAATTTHVGRSFVGLAPVFGTFAWTTPVDGTHQSSGFGRRWGRLHAGVDFAGPVGAPLRSVCSGVVAFAGVQSGYGNKVEVQCWDGTTTSYGHMHTLDVRAGQQLRSGDRIGALGNSGRSTGPHLHFEVRPGGLEPVDPVPWLESRGIRPVETPPPAPAP